MRLQGSEYATAYLYDDRVPAGSTQPVGAAAK
jgi:hypothetical protein